MLLLAAAAAALAPRCPAPRLQQTPSIDIRQIQKSAELPAALEDTPTHGVSLLMLSVPDCARAVKVKKFLLDRSAPNPQVQHLSLEVADDDAETWRSFKCNPARTPHCIAYDADGDRVSDFVAMSPGALFYGLEDLGGVLTAREAEDAQAGGGGAEEPPPFAGVSSELMGSDAFAEYFGGGSGVPPPPSGLSSAGPTTAGGGSTDARLTALESLVAELRAEVSAQQAALAAATRRIAALEEAAGG